MVISSNLFFFPLSLSRCFFINSIWKDLSLNDVISEHERAQFAVWDYPVSDRYTKIRAQMDELDIPKSFEAALRKVRNSNSSKEGYALIGKLMEK